MNTWLLSIDPGVNGGAAMFIESAPAFLFDVMSFKYREDWETELYAWLCACRPLHIVMEDVHSFPGQGVKSMFTFGRAVGAVKAVIKSSRCEYELIQPEAWQNKLQMPKHRDIIDPRKRRAARVKDQKAKALSLFPQLAKEKGDIYAAVLIGYAVLL